MSKLQIITKGILKENPTFVLILGMCPTIGVTSSAINGMGMGVATMAVLIMSNMAISMIKSFVPDKVRIPAFIVVIASFVTIIEMLMKAYMPSLYESLGVFIPLIVVNCIILGRAEAFASKNGIFDSLLDGVGIGLGFTLALTAIGAVREKLVALQQQMGKERGVVMDGRDIGTVVFPDAELKIYMTADAQVRAERRYNELTAKGDKVTLEEILENVISRDNADMTRAISPLRKADDAIILDNSYMSVEEQMAWFMERYEAIVKG